MKDQLKLLDELQKHDARIQELEGAKRSIPTKLEGMRVDLAKVEAMLERERAELAETEKWRRDKEEEGKAEETQLSRAKAKAGAVKNAKEYMASQREVEATRKMQVDTEESLRSLTAASAQAQARIAAHETDVEKLRQVVQAEEDAAQTRVAAIDRDVDQLRHARDAAAKKVRADVLKKYAAIRMRRGLAVVPVVGGTCRGCNMNIPPQLYNILQRGNSIELCPNCYRIVYWDQLMVDPDGAPTERDSSA